jgi:hypothetical protein
MGLSSLEGYRKWLVTMRLVAQHYPPPGQSIVSQTEKAVVKAIGIGTIGLSTKKLGKLLAILGSGIQVVSGPICPL